MVALLLLSTIKQKYRIRVFTVCHHTLHISRILLFKFLKFRIQSNIYYYYYYFVVVILLLLLLCCVVVSNIWCSPPLLR